MIMILGLSASTFTTLHVIISLIGIAAGLVVLYGMLNATPLPGWTAVFLAATVLTSVTGFFFPAAHILPSHIVGIISLAVLALALAALYLFHLHGAWRWIYVVSAMVALYFNCFVGVVQAFQKIPALHALAPTQSEPPFATAQLAVLAIFIVLGFLAVKRFHPAAGMTIG
jgi:hypothetical protein